MWTNRFMIAAVVSVAGLLMGTNAAQAQRNSYYYGTYYPWKNEFVTYDEHPTSQFSRSPEEFGLSSQRQSYYYSTRSMPTNTYVVERAPAVDTASIEVMVPDSQARVWFDGTSTTSVGTDRFFHTPALTRGFSYTYQVKVAWQKDGHEVTRTRTVSVAPGQTTVVDFTH